MKRLVLFNTRGGVGTTTVVFNVGHMLARLGRNVVIVDCDPQCRLSALALSEAELAAALAGDVAEGRTVAACVERGRADVRAPVLVELAEHLQLLPGDLSLARFETGPGIDAALERLLVELGEAAAADIILFDVGPGLGPLNRAVLRCCDAVVVALAHDLFAARSLENVGAALTAWRADGAAHRAMAPIGYLIEQHLERDEVLLRADPHWVDNLPGHYARLVLGETREGDPDRLAHLRHFASLVPLARVARKPIFDLKHADGVLGAQLQLVERARVEFTALAQKILARLDAV